MKKINHLCFLAAFGALLFMLPVRAEPPAAPTTIPAPVPTEADRLAEEVSTALSTTRPPGGLSHEELEEWIRVNGDAIIARLEDFMARYPKHEARWKFQFILTNVTRTFIGSDAKQQDAAWTAQREAWRQEILTSPEVPRQF